MRIRFSTIPSQTSLSWMITNSNKLSKQLVILWFAHVPWFLFLDSVQNYRQVNLGTPQEILLATRSLRKASVAHHLWTVQMQFFAEYIKDFRTSKSEIAASEANLKTTRLILVLKDNPKLDDANLYLRNHASRKLERLRSKCPRAKSCRVIRAVKTENLHIHGCKRCKAQS